jgi:phosphopantetheinyl transferase (holo-ACP synthase)
VGIDVAWPAEFAGRYPYTRAFESKELESARMLTCGDSSRSAALLWSVKEAAVKAVGTGFHRHDPRHVNVSNFRPVQGGVLFHIHADRPVFAWAREEGKGWLAVAVSA